MKYNLDILVWVCDKSIICKPVQQWLVYLLLFLLLTLIFTIGVKFGKTSAKNKDSQSKIKEKKDGN